MFSNLPDLVDTPHYAMGVWTASFNLAAKSISCNSHTNPLFHKLKRGRYIGKNPLSKSTCNANSNTNLTYFFLPSKHCQVEIEEKYFWT